MLIFTQFADTAHYLYDNLKHLGRIRAVESGTAEFASGDDAEFAELLAQSKGD